jgi:hypothetical protein
MNRGIKKGGRFMSTDDRSTVGEYAKRYKVRDKDLAELCQAYGLSAESVVSREEFRQMLAGCSEKKSKAAELASRAKEDVKVKKDGSPPKGKEEKVSEAKKTFERWVKIRKVRHPVYLKVSAGYKDNTMLTGKEFDMAYDKYLLNKEL